MPYFHKFRNGWLGRESFTHAELVGWKVAWRATSQPGFSPPLQRKRFSNPSRFGVLREIIQNCRKWTGKVFFLRIEQIEPIYQAHYKLDDDQDE